MRPTVKSTEEHSCFHQSLELTLISGPPEAGGSSPPVGTCLSHVISVMSITDPDDE